MPRLLESWNSLLRIEASSGAQVLRTFAGLPQGLWIWRCQAGEGFGGLFVWRN